MFDHFDDDKDLGNSAISTDHSPQRDDAAIGNWQSLILPLCPLNQRSLPQANSFKSQIFILNIECTLILRNNCNYVHSG